jgi:outer membrane protein OmpA-like peptidoglycan-associated protein
VVGVLIQGLRTTMVKRSLRQSRLLACFAIVAASVFAAPSSLSAARPPRQVKQYAYLQDTGKTIALPVGQELIVTLPLRPYDDNYWYVARNSGAPLKLIAGPDERRPRNWTPWMYSSQVFYFQRESPGTAHLVLEQSYFSKPMILKVLDESPPVSPSPPPPPPLPTVREKLVLRGIHFDFNKSRIRPGDAAVLDEDASTLKANPNMAVNVNGYCDAIGGEEYNLKLSDRRAVAVVDYLVKSGIQSSQLIPHGYGKTDFVATNDTAEGRAQNRRVELVPNE